MSTYDLRADVRAVLDSSNLTDPGEIADKVAESIPASALRAALHVTLRSYVRQVMAETRTNSAPNFRSPAAGRSVKVQAIRDGWQRQLDNRVHVGDSEWKLLGDCTYEDLLACAAEREAIAARNQSMARYYRGLAGLVAEHDTAALRDVPAEVLMPALGAVA